MNRSSRFAGLSSGISANDAAIDSASLSRNAMRFSAPSGSRYSRASHVPRSSAEIFAGTSNGASSLPLFDAIGLTVSGAGACAHAHAAATAEANAKMPL